MGENAKEQKEETEMKREDPVAFKCSSLEICVTASSTTGIPGHMLHPATMKSKESASQEGLSEEGGTVGRRSNREKKKKAYDEYDYGGGSDSEKNKKRKKDE
eukprot:TRINITY_DN1287_c0_g1_i1.p3 TRINITY_DN1287_c0_g1~~TRINITY_DN1287_c0_g1_i1.p3  ORF type:complete len:102 (+),score=30.53 TRINITY_DN1287_c0_g1_i1:91-396(+)